MSSERNNFQELRMLITSAGRRCELLECFRKDAQSLAYPLRVFACDLNPAMSPACHFADSVVQLPRCTDKDYPKQLLQYCLTNGVTLVVPTIDTELEILAKNKQTFQAAGVDVIVSEIEAIEVCRDKYQTAIQLDNHGVLTPRTWKLSAWNSAVFQKDMALILKPIDGSNSLGIQRVNIGQKVPEKKDSERWILQEYLEGTEFTVNCFVDKSGSLSTAIPHIRKEVRGGEVSKGTTVDDTELQAISGKVVATLPSLRGPFCFQAKRTASGRTCVFEINARFGGGFPLAHHAGGAFTKWILEEHLGLPSSQTSVWSPGLTCLRFDQAIYVTT